MLKEIHFFFNKADLLVIFGHPFFPAVEHLQPFCFSLPQNHNGNFFSSVGIKNQIYLDKHYIVT